jgi:hypothetical protein
MMGFGLNPDCKYIAIPENRLRLKRLGKAILQQARLKMA